MIKLARRRIAIGAGPDGYWSSITTDDAAAAVVAALSAPAGSLQRGRRRARDPTGVLRRLGGCAGHPATVHRARRPGQTRRTRSSCVDPLAADQQSPFRRRHRLDTRVSQCPPRLAGRRRHGIDGDPGGSATASARRPFRCLIGASENCSVHRPALRPCWRRLVVVALAATMAAAVLSVGAVRAPAASATVATPTHPYAGGGIVPFGDAAELRGPERHPGLGHHRDGGDPRRPGVLAGGGGRRGLRLR